MKNLFFYLTTISCIIFSKNHFWSFLGPLFLVFEFVWLMDGLDLGVWHIFVVKVVFLWRFHIFCCFDIRVV